MITIRSASERGSANFGWLDSRHTFSFGNYYDPAYMGFSSLRVINEDKVASGQGFPTHSHRDMEIISYVIDGALEHKDSIGTGSVIRPGDVQRMSAGTGISHSEYNASKENSVHFLQIWVLPEKQGIEPGYEQTYFSPEEKQGKLRLVGSHDGRDGSITIHQDMNLYAARLTTDEQVDYTLQAHRAVWIQVVRGGINLNGSLLSAGDGAAITGSETLVITGQTDDAEILLFDMTA
ncbi:pirin-related protein [Leptolyngbya sp. Heron Island J]|uniref:pirin family protein n=1 Tax=Leptolyngbya sp. Heron Island J TaxID=1385935 RepID=UPI0003B98AEF|nr:pirin family protein [Leptolyngbya sp. Heron Island J]ESA39144.1 pirin-related protein [Leptolyngbya sp. Heron Island J]